MKPIDSEARARWRLIAAARLRSEGYTQKEIAARLETNQPEVSRLLEAAERRNFLSPGPALLRKNIDPKDYAAAEKEFLRKDRLGKVLAPLVPRNLYFEARVAYGDEGTFPFAAAERVLELIPRVRRLGVMWGRSVGEVVNGIRGRRDQLDEGLAAAIECIPLCGDPLFLINDRRVKYSSSVLAAMLGETLNASPAHALPTLSGVPAYISCRRAEEAETTLENWKTFIQGIPGYSQIFGNGSPRGRPLIQGVDTIITGLGIIATGEGAEASPWRETGDFINERIIQDEVSKTDLSRLIFGDIGGLLVARKRIGKDGPSKVKGLNAGWMGLTFADLERVARQASLSGPPGVIVIAYGRWKAEIIKAIIRLGYVNQLIVDPTLARALGARL